MKRFIIFFLLAIWSLSLVACAIESPNAPDNDNLSTVEKHDEQSQGGKGEGG